MKSHLLDAHLTAAQFKGVTPERIHETYLSVEEHARAAGQRASQDAREDGEFLAYICVEPFRAYVNERPDPPSFSS